MPAEWEPHEATWLAWPHERTDWPGKFAPIPWVYADIVRHLARVERVRILVGRPRRGTSARRILEKTGADLGRRGFLRRAHQPRLDPRLRPHLRQERAEAGIAVTNWRFNAWAKYDDWKKDDAATSRLIPKLKLPVWEPQHQRPPRRARRRQHRRQRPRHAAHHRRMPAQPGPGAQSGLHAAPIWKRFSATTSASTQRPLARATASPATTRTATWTISRASSIPTTVVTVVEDEPSDANYEPLRENLARLREMKDQDGQPLRVETLPMPEPVYFDGQRLPASYANFYIANHLVLVPTFNDANDRVALNTLAGLFPDREVVGIACRDLVLGLGTLHCMTQQQPAP